MYVDIVISNVFNLNKHFFFSKILLKCFKLINLFTNDKTQGIPIQGEQPIASSNTIFMYVDIVISNIFHLNKRFFFLFFSFFFFRATYSIIQHHFGQPIASSNTISGNLYHHPTPFRATCTVAQATGILRII